MNNYVLNRWSIPFAGFLLALMGGISYAWGVFVVPMTKIFGWTHTQATLPFTTFMLVFAFSMAPAGMLQDKIGPRKVSLLGAILFLIAYTLASLVNFFPHPWWLVFSYGLIGGTACGLVYACVAPPARKWFPDKPGLAISLAVMGFGLATVFIAPLKANFLIPTYGINGTLLIMAIATSLVCSFAAWLTRNPTAKWSPKGWSQAKQHISTQEKKQHKLEPKDLIKNRLFITIWIMFALLSAGGIAAIGILPSFAQESLGFSPTNAALALSFLAAINGLGRPLAGLLSDRFGIIWVMIITYLLQTIAFLSIPYTVSTPISLFAISGLLGWGLAVTLALFPTLTSKSFGVVNFGTNYGLVFTAFGIGAISPLLASWSFDTLGNYDLVFLTAAATTATGLILSILLKNKYTFL